MCENPKTETYVQNVLKDSDHSYKYYVELSDGRIVRVPKSKHPVIGQDVVVKNNGKIKGYSNFLLDVLLSILYLFFIGVLILVVLGMGVGLIGLVLFMFSPEADRL